MSKTEAIAQQTTDILARREPYDPMDIAADTVAAIDYYLEATHVRSITLDQYRVIRAAIATAINYSRTINGRK